MSKLCLNSLISSEIKANEMDQIRGRAGIAYCGCGCSEVCNCTSESTWDGLSDDTIAPITVSATSAAKSGAVLPGTR